MAKARPASASSSGKMTYYFSKTRTEGKGLSKQLLGGKGLDMLQYGAGFAIAFTLLGLFATIFLERAL